jgi:hypothetical protein
MSSQKYSVNQHLIETILAWVKSGEIIISSGNPVSVRVGRKQSPRPDGQPFFIYLGAIR